MKFARKIELIEVVLVQWHNLILQIGSKPSLSAIGLWSSHMQTTVEVSANIDKRSSEEIVIKVSIPLVRSIAIFINMECNLTA